MVYTTGSKDDWDHISRITGDPAWAWDAMSHYRDLNQNYVPPNDNHNDVGLKQVLLLILSSLFLDGSIPPVGTQSQWNGAH